MNDYEIWKDRIKSISPERELTPQTTNPEFTVEERPEDRHLKHLYNSLHESEEKRTVLWNTRPANRINVLHAVYLEKLVEFQQAGFETTIVIFDKYEQERQQLSPARAKQKHRKAIEFAHDILDWGLDADRTEILLETDLRAACNPEDIVETIVMLGNAIDLDPGDGDDRSESADGLLPEVIEKIIEIHYESVINCDAILAGQDDLENVWNDLREALVAGDLFEEYTEPLVFGMPRLTKGSDGTPPAANELSNTIHTGLNRSEIEQRLRGSEAFRTDVFDLFLLQKETVRRSGERIREYDQLSERMSEREASQFIADRVETHF